LQYEVLEQIRGKILVSCQGAKDGGNPFYLPEHMLLMAKAAHAGGCAGFRANTPPNIKIIKEFFPTIPMIGIYKIVEEGSDVYITPNMAAVDELVSLNCEIIAIDGTNRKNARGQYGCEFIAEVKEKYPDQIVMADLATFEEAKLCAKAGADILATTMAGYTAESVGCTTAAFDLLKEIRQANLGRFIICEGKIWTVEDADKAFESGADSIVIGKAVTSPISITKRFVEQMKERNHEKPVLCCR